MSETEKLTRLFAALGADDPQGWAESEVAEDLPQLARYRLLRALSQDVRSWDTSASDSPRAVARETTFGILYLLADPDSDDLPSDLRHQLPGWILMETTPAGELTHRRLDALYEDLEYLDPPADGTRGRTVAEGWIRDTNLRPFCESLAAEVAYDFDDSDWLAIHTALPDTDDEQPRSAWYAYPLVGRDRVDLRIARSVGGSEISVSVEGTVPDHTRSRVGLLLDIMARYEIAPD
ncbi:hypothetical protein [Streptomyces sp. NPDC057257]|uniref:hypothetical protein n=1 Tax=Streptomyces sp. NPDC057257 TaxID=3346071 RepID=UPI00363CEAFE